MKCEKCQQENPPGVNVCGRCGSGLRNTPPALDSKIEPTTSNVVAEPERKHLTALCADLCGLPTMTEERDTEKVKHITEQIFTGVQQIVTKHDGFMERVTDNRFAVVFGAHRSHEHDPVRAIHAAKEMQDLVNSMNLEFQERHGVQLEMRTGIDTGLVLAGEVDIEKGPQGVKSDVISMASTLSSLAQPGEILVGNYARGWAADFVSFEDRRFRKIEGKPEAIEVSRVSSVNGLYRKAGFYRHVTSVMVGREEELSKLEFQVVKATLGKGSLVNVTGEAGIGKSRLIEELKKREIMRRVTVLEGRVMSIGKNLSFHPIIDLLKSWAQIVEGDLDAAKLDKLEHAIKAIHPDETSEILPFVATLMGIKLSGKNAERVEGIEGEALEKLIFKSVKELLVKGSEIRPTVIILEDLHWADASSTILLESLCPLVKKNRIVFINVYRPGYLKSDFGRTEKAVQSPDDSFLEIEIPALDANKSGVLVDNMLSASELPYDVKNQILMRAGGNPFFIEEMVNSLIDEGAVVEKRGRFEVTDKIETVVVPPNLKDVLMSRIDRLELRTRELVNIAAVIGKSFFDRIVKDVADSIEDIQHKLEYLKDLQLIQSHMRMEELEYMFKHALVQEAAYESIPFERRKPLHLRVAVSIERKFSYRLREFYGILSYHYGRAESHEKTEEYLLKAGEEALRSSASNEALGYYQEALSLYRMLRGDRVDPEKIAILEKNIGLALFNRGRYAEAVQHFDKALDYYWGELPKNSLSTAFKVLSSSMTFFLALYFPSRWHRKLPTQRDVETLGLFYKKAQALALIDPKRFFNEFFFLHATVARFDLTKLKFGMGIFAGASALFHWSGLSFSVSRRILDYAKPRLDANDPKELITYNLLDTQNLFLKGQWNDITDYSDDLVNRVLKIGEVWDAAQHYYWHGLPKIFQGHFDEARLLVAKLNDIAETYKNKMCILLKHLMSIYLLIECRDTDEAAAEVNLAIDLARSEGWGLSIMNMYSLKAAIEILKNDMEQAGESLDQASKSKAELRAAPLQLAAFYRSQFEYHLLRLEESQGLGYKEEASEHKRNAFKFGKPLIKICRKAALYRTESYKLMAIYKSLILDQKGSAKWWRMAISEGESLKALPQLSRTYAEIGKRYSLTSSESFHSDVIPANVALGRAKKMFGELGLRRDLDALNEVISQTDDERL